jgi:hypothetical protein
MNAMAIGKYHYCIHNFGLVLVNNYSVTKRRTKKAILERNIAFYKDYDNYLFNAK